MDFSTRIEYERKFELAIKDPVTGKDSGIKFYVIAADAEPVIKVLREAQAKYFRERAINGDSVVPDDMELEVLVASVTDWTWGEAAWGHIKDGVPATEENKRFVLGHQNAGWLRQQVKEGCGRIENFTQE